MATRDQQLAAQADDLMDWAHAHRTDLDALERDRRYADGLRAARMQAMLGRAAHKAAERRFDPLAPISAFGALA